MKSVLYHIQLNVGDVARSIPFYRALFEYLEYRIMVAEPDTLGVSDGTTDIWIIGGSSRASVSPAGDGREPPGLPGEHRR